MKIKEKLEEIKINIQDVNKLQNIQDFYESLLTSVKEVGGDATWITEETTIKELADVLAVNKISFYSNRVQLR